MPCPWDAGAARCEPAAGSCLPKSQIRDGAEPHWGTDPSPSLPQTPQPNSLIPFSPHFITRAHLGSGEPCAQRGAGTLVPGQISSRTGPAI